jgi:hypothetical protein
MVGAKPHLALVRQIAVDGAVWLAILLSLRKTPAGIDFYSIDWVGYWNDNY